MRFKTFHLGFWLDELLLFFFFDSHILQCGLDCYFCFFGEGMGLGWWSLWRMNMTIVSWFYTFFKIHSSSKKEKKNKKTITWKWIEMRTWWFFYFIFSFFYIHSYDDLCFLDHGGYRTFLRWRGISDSNSNEFYDPTSIVFNDFQTYIITILNHTNPYTQVSQSLLSLSSSFSFDRLKETKKIWCNLFDNLCYIDQVKRWPYDHDMGDR